MDSLGDVWWVWLLESPQLFYRRNCIGSSGICWWKSHSFPASPQISSLLRRQKSPLASLLTQSYHRGAGLILLCQFWIPPPHLNPIVFLHSYLFISLFVFFFFWGPQVSRLGVKLELQLPAYTAATTTPDSSRVCNLHHGLWQCQILNPLSEARDRISILLLLFFFCFLPF